MTKEELAVVQAAMQWHYVVLANPKALDPLANMFNPVLPALNELKRVTWLLATSCEECNAGGHTCPGDGVSIPHGATDCGKHDDVIHAGAGGACPDYGSKLDPCPPGCASGVCVANDPTRCPPAAADVCVCSRTEKMYCAASDCHGGADVLQWFERTWVDVRQGDTVRLPGSENTAYLRSAVHQKWHVDPRSSEYRPVAMEWACVHVELEVNVQGSEWTCSLFDMDPTKPILIQMTQSEVDAIELLGGWSARIGMIMTEVPR